jgi:hypothetical protein
VGDAHVYSQYMFLIFQCKMANGGSRQVLIAEVVDVLERNYAYISGNYFSVMQLNPLYLKVIICQLY